LTRIMATNSAKTLDIQDGIYKSPIYTL